MLNDKQITFMSSIHTYVDANLSEYTEIEIDERVIFSHGSFNFPNLDAFRT